MMKKNTIIFWSVVLTLAVIAPAFSTTNKTAYPAVNCLLSMTMVNDSTYVIDNYAGPYVFESKILAGNPQIVNSNDTIHLSGTGFSVILMARDTNNCFVQQTINKF